MRLADLYPTLSPDERKALADSADLALGYLWQIATGWRGKRPSLEMIRRLANADSRLTIGELAEEFATDKAGAA